MRQGHLSAALMLPWRTIPYDPKVCRKDAGLHVDSSHWPRGLGSREPRGLALTLHLHGKVNGFSRRHEHDLSPIVSRLALHLPNKRAQVGHLCGGHIVVSPTARKPCCKIVGATKEKRCERVISIAARKALLVKARGCRTGANIGACREAQFVGAKQRDRPCDPVAPPHQCRRRGLLQDRAHHFNLRLISDDAQLDVNSFPIRINSLHCLVILARARITTQNISQPTTLW
mmetsp:Transcript_27997/g.90526  ORF Transcript_27997/g.90526 Transcript_27997/m.90526 type:complete len:230 (-) Transcript_27997:485-1174(-)